MKKNVLVIGGGNSAHVIAAYATILDSVVYISSATTIDWPFHMSANFLGNETSSSAAQSYSSHMDAIFSYVIFTTTCKASISFIEDNFHIFQYQNPIVIFLYGQGNASTVLEQKLKYLNINLTILSLFTLPWVCRIQEKGRRVNIFYRYRKVFYGLSNDSDRDSERQAISFLNQCCNHSSEFIKNGDLLSASLGTTNQIYHPPRTAQLLREYPNGWAQLSDVPMFYRKIPNEVFSIMERLDNEISEIKTLYKRHCANKDYQILNLVESECHQTGFGFSTIADFVNLDPSLDSIITPTVMGIDGRHRLDVRHRFIVDDVFDGLKFSAIVGESLGHNCNYLKKFTDQFFQFRAQRI